MLGDCEPEGIPGAPLLIFFIEGLLSIAFLDLDTGKYTHTVFNMGIYLPLSRREYGLLVLSLHMQSRRRIDRKSAQEICPLCSLYRIPPLGASTAFFGLSFVRDRQTQSP